MIKAIKGPRNTNLAVARCDKCCSEESFPACHDDKSGGMGRAINRIMHLKEPGKVNKRLADMGWNVTAKSHLCPKCEEKRKVVNMPTQKPKLVEASLPEMTRREKVAIFTMLAEVYDIDAGRYRQGDTDEVVAGVLGVRIGFVSSVREADFGPDGGNQNIENLVARMAEMEKAVEAILQSACNQEELAEKKVAEISTMRNELNKIRKAVGPRALQKAHV